MKLSILVDNNSIIDRYFLAEPAVSYFIETDELKVLFDLGYSDVFLKNARKMGIDPLSADYLVLSHGHIDHTGGLDLFIKECVEGKMEHKRSSCPTVVGHPELFRPKILKDRTSVGITVSEEVVEAGFEVKKTRAPLWLGKDLVFLGEIEQSLDFEKSAPIGYRFSNDRGEWLSDDLIDDTALAYRSPEGLVIISGCSHRGICNIIETAKRVTGEDRVIDVVGGFHLLDPEQHRLRNTVEYFADLQLRSLHACHCTDFRSKKALSEVAELEAVGSGMVLSYP
ncbi:MAG TPA: MBL fold metallo-hydrolase [Sediminispirochaeta sp.]|nr:MBL fold metallo-hydrolase [Sediminispirochaeta sp.]